MTSGTSPGGARRAPRTASPISRPASPACFRRLRPGPRLCQTACLSLSHGSCPPGSIDLQIRRFQCGYPDRFRSVRDLGFIAARCSPPSGELQGRSSVWLPAWLPTPAAASNTVHGRLSASCALWHHLLVDNDWDRFASVCQQALGELVEGRPEPFKALWSHADDVVIMGAFGGYERGWQQVSARLDWAAKGIKSTRRSAENVLTVVSGDLAYTVDLEHMTRHAGDQLMPRTLRCTQVYRREDGEWKVVLRHADELPRKDEQQR
jgi:ketosteroid isomerase-like protein